MKRLNQQRAGMVNGLFTIFDYPTPMIVRASNMIRNFAKMLAILAAAMLITGGEAHAQDGQINWEDAGVANLTPFPSGTTTPGTDGTDATITWTTQTQGTGAFNPAFGGSFVSYFNGTIGSGVSPLLVSFDNSSYDPRDRVVVTITLTRSVRNLRFAINDIDNGNFADAVEVYYDDDLAGNLNNAATNTAFWTSNAANTRTNDATVNGWRGIANSANNSTAGDVAFNFGSQQVRRVQIVYYSYTGTGDPGTQFLTITDLRFAQQSADLSLTKQLVSSVPGNGGDATWRLTATNSSTSEIAANAIVVRDNLPSQFVFESASGTGTFDPASGQWAVGSLAPGASASIDITGAINAPAGTVVTNSAEIIASSAFDLDSTPNNAVTTEDDFASSALTVRDFSTTIPPLSCPVGQTVFDWDAPSVSWTGGTTSNTYALASFGNIGFNITGNAIFAARASFGGAVPALTTAISGGLSPAQLALAYNADNTTTAQQFVTTITLPRVFNGVQFSIFDIDASAGFQDRITAYGLLNGVRVNAIMTGSAQNSASGDTILGTGGAGDTLGIANGTVTFFQPIDTIVFEYGNGPAAPANPTNQSIALHDITFCNPLEPRISVTKVSAIIADPINGNTNPKAIPGALIEYLITVSNTGPGAADADSLSVVDQGPGDVKLCRITRSGGPIAFNDPGGNSGVTYGFATVASPTDDLEFSNNNGASFDYTPTPDADDCDTAITDFRVRPDGAFASGGTITLRVRYILE